MKNLLDKLDENQRVEFVNAQLNRYNASAEYYRAEHENWEQYWKVYHRIKDDQNQTDEPDNMMPIAFGIIEDAVARRALSTVTNIPVIPKPKRPNHAKAAERFANICKDYFASAEYRVDKIDAERERGVCGSYWEFDEWRNDWIEGKRWDRIPRVEKTAGMPEAQGKPVGDELTYTDTVEVLHKIPEARGYRTRFPNIENVFPEPGITRVKKLKWIIEVEPEVALSDLRKQMVEDPITNGLKPVYDLTEFDKDHDEEALKSLRPIDIISAPTGTTIKEAVTDNGRAESDTPSVHLMRIHEPNGIHTIIQGKYLVQSVTDLWHKPGIKARIRVNTQQRHSIYGKSMLEPILDSINELDDIHNLSMQNWIRIINKMVVYDEEVIKYPDDFKPRAGGKIRARLGGRRSVSDAFASVDQPDVTGSMLAMESNTKGIIERAVAISDLSPGVAGTRQTHDTYSGLMEIQSNLARRFSVMNALEISWYQDQMDTMYWLYEQFMFDKMSFSVFDGKGAFRAEEYVREDIETEGSGFVFIQTDDPSFGDSNVQRNQNMILFNQAMQYEAYRRNVKDPTLPRIELGELLKKMYKSFGWSDVSTVMTHDYGVAHPDDEWAAMLQGAVVMPNPQENLIFHMLTHIKLRQSAEIQDAILNKRIPPEAILMLEKHIQATMSYLKMIMTHPDEAAQDLLNKTAMTEQKEPVNVAGMSTTPNYQQVQAQDIGGLS